MTQPHADDAASRSRPTRYQAEAALREMFTDDVLLGFGADLGVDLTDRDQVLDAAAVGLTVLCWRNTSVEDVHAGVEAEELLEARLGAAASDDARARDRADAEAEKRAVYAALDADIDTYQKVADSAELDRIAKLLAGRERGYGIPNDVMFRLNVSTARQVRQVLDTTLPSGIATPGFELPYPATAAPEHIMGLVAMLSDPSRSMTVGAASVSAGDVLGRTWEQYTEDVLRKIGPHLRFADALGTRRAVWHIALSGRSYAGRWFPQRAWQPAVDCVRDAIRGGAPADAATDATRWHPEADDATFWATLATTPERLNARQARWLMYDSRFDAVLTTNQQRYIDKLNGQTPARFSFVMAHF